MFFIMTQLLYQVFKAEQVEPLDRVEESETAFEKIIPSLLLSCFFGQVPKKW